MFGFNQRAMPTQGPWSGLPTAAAPWQGSSQVWQPAQQAPWRMSPWQTQGMPAATPIAPAVQPATSAAPSPYLSQGTSQGLSGFNPLTPGGGMYPLQQQPQQQQQATGAGQGYVSGGAASPTWQGAFESGQGGMPIALTRELWEQNPSLDIPGGINNPIHPLYGQYDPFGMRSGGTFGFGS